MSEKEETQNIVAESEKNPTQDQSAPQDVVNKGGRPSKFDEIDLRKVEKLYKKGWTDKEVADFLEVTEQTINNWKKSHPVFFESLKDWKRFADEKVERSLYERACGYSHPEEKIFQHDGEIIRAETTKQYPPDATSGIFWLKNRQPERWRDSKDIELSTSKDSPFTIMVQPVETKTKDRVNNNNDTTSVNI